MLPLPQENTPSSWASSRIKHEIQPICLGSKPFSYLLQNKVKNLEEIQNVTAIE